MRHRAGRLYESAPWKHVLRLLARWSLTRVSVVQSSTEDADHAGNSIRKISYIAFDIFLYRALKKIPFESAWTKLDF